MFLAIPHLLPFADSPSHLQVHEVERRLSAVIAAEAGMSSYLLKQADKLTLGLVGAACLAALGDAYVKRAKTLEGDQSVVDAMLKEKERLQTERPQSSSVENDQVCIYYSSHATAVCKAYSVLGHMPLCTKVPTRTSSRL